MLVSECRGAWCAAGRPGRRVIHVPHRTRIAAEAQQEQPQQHAQNPTHAMASLWRSLSFMLMGRKHFTRQGYETAARAFDNSCMQASLAGRVAMVTGANTGLGLQVAHALAARGATLFMLCRNEERGRRAVEDVVAASGNADVHLEVCDVSSLASIAAFADAWLAAQRPLHILVNNAGVLLNERQATPEGHEASFATNALGTAALTQRLLPALIAGAPSRVIIVSSGGMYTAPLLLGDLGHERMQPWDGVTAYARDKRRQLALAEHLAATWAQHGVSVFCMHPGWADTEGVRTSIPGFHAAFKGSLRDAAQGADTIVWLMLEAASKLQPGGFYLDRQPQPKHLALGGTQYTPAQAAQLYSQLMGLAGLEAAAAGSTSAAAAESSCGGQLGVL